MKNHNIFLNIDGNEIKALADILPSDNKKLKMLMIAKVPAPVSVEAGHYFQGKQGTMLWNKLKQYEILNVPDGQYEDDFLLMNNFGITDIVKVPRGYGNEPSPQEYKEGLKRILQNITNHTPEVILFVYKKVLDNILTYGFNVRQKTNYGFNPQFESFFQANIFVFPMPGTPCTSNVAHTSMLELKKIINK